MAHVDFNKPDMLLCYIGGGAGRALVHIVMLSPEMHSWSPALEMHLAVESTKHRHASIKLEYFMDNVFPVTLRNNLSDWKTYEPGPWDAKFHRTKQFIRHDWMREDDAHINAYGTSKVAYINYADTLDFCINAAIDKKAEMIISKPNGEIVKEWCQRKPTEVADIIVEQRKQAIAALARWQGYRDQYGWHEINLHKFFFSEEDDFMSEYISLCNYYNISAVPEQAIELRNHWLTFNK